MSLYASCPCGIPEGSNEAHLRTDCPLYGLRPKGKAMTDTNNTDGAALLPVTQDRLIYVRWSDDGQHITKWAREPFDGATKFANAGNGAPLGPFDTDNHCPVKDLPFALRSIAGNIHVECADHVLEDMVRIVTDAANELEASQSQALPATQEDAERSGVGELVSRAFATLEKYSHWIPNDEWRTIIAERDAALSTPAMSDLQRQEYDGEAVRVSDAWIKDPNGYSDADCVAILLAGYAADKQREGLPATAATLQRAADLLTETSHRFSAVLAHPAQAPAQTLDLSANYRSSADATPSQAVDETEKWLSLILRLREALERIADPRNTHFAGDAQVVARDALAALTNRGEER